MAVGVFARTAAAVEPGKAQASSRQASTWKPTAPADYNWTDAANWSGAIPNAKGAAAQINIGLQGRMTVNLGGPITLGRLNVGQTAGEAGAATLDIVGNNPLTFESASPGEATFFNITQGKVPDGIRLDLAAGIRLAGSSSLTMTIASPSVFDCNVRSLELNGNNFTLDGPRRFQLGEVSGVNVEVGSISGSGNYVQNGCGITIRNGCPDFNGTMAINNGDCHVEGLLPAVTDIVIAGANMKADKYPRGGYLFIGNWNEGLKALPIPARFDSKARLTFQGGSLFCRGQGLDEAVFGKSLDETTYPGTGRPAVVTQVRQIQFLRGGSEILINNGNNVSTCSTLMATDPANALVRSPGAVLMLGGRGIITKTGYNDITRMLGETEKLVFASGISSHLKGTGGPPGSKTRSIIPWITTGSLTHPGQAGFATYDKDLGAISMRKDEWDGTITGTPDRNVHTGGLKFGANGQQTVNSLVCDCWESVDLDEGSTLTITSGGLQLVSMGGTSIGKPGVASTISFGSAEGVIWTPWVAKSETTIHTVIAGSGGLTKAATGKLVLTAANTYTGTTYVADGDLQIGDGKTTASKLGDGDVEVSNGNSLCIRSKVANAILDTATVTLWNAGTAFYGTMDLDSGVNETVGALVLDGKAQPAGTYGSKDSAATHKLDNYFSGPGIVTVAKGQ